VGHLVSSDGGRRGFVFIPSGTLAWVVSPPSPVKLEARRFEGPLEQVVFGVPLATALVREVTGQFGSGETECEVGGSPSVIPSADTSRFFDPGRYRQRETSSLLLAAE